MKLNKIGMGLAVAALMSVTAVSAFAANEENDKLEEQITAEIQTFDEGTLISEAEGKTLLNKRVLEENEDVEDINAELKLFENGTLNTEVEGKETLKKETVN